MKIKNLFSLLNKSKKSEVFTPLIPPKVFFPGEKPRLQTNSPDSSDRKADQEKEAIKLEFANSTSSTNDIDLIIPEVTVANLQDTKSQEFEFVVLPTKSNESEISGDLLDLEGEENSESIEQLYLKGAESRFDLEELFSELVEENSLVGSFQENQIESVEEDEKVSTKVFNLFDEQLPILSTEEELLELNWHDDSGSNNKFYSDSFTEGIQKTSAGATFEVGNPLYLDLLNENELLELH